MPKVKAKVRLFSKVKITLNIVCRYSVLPLLKYSTFAGHTQRI